MTVKYKLVAPAGLRVARRVSRLICRPQFGLAVLALGLLGVIAPRLEAAIGTPVSIGQAANATAGPTLAVTAAAGVPVGETIIVMISMDPGTAPAITSIADTGGNTYSIDANAAGTFTGTTGARVVIASAHVTTALVSGNSITVTFSASTTDKAMSVYHVSGLAVSPLDKTASTTGTAGSPVSSGTTAATTQGNELLIAAFAIQRKNVSISTYTTGWTGLTGGASQSGNAAKALAAEYQIVSATGAYTVSQAYTPSGSADWAGAIVTYKGVALATATTVASSGTPSTYGSGVTFTATVTAGATGTVDFYDGATLLGAGTLNASSPNTATCTTTALQLTTGTHATITAAYLGDGSHAGSTSTAISQTVNAKALSVAGLLAASTVYDGTTVAKLTGTAALLAAETAGTGTTADGKPYTGDVVSISGTAAGTLALKDVGARAVTITGNTLAGAGAVNYTLTQQAGLSQLVTAKALTLTTPAVTSKVYDGTTAATITGSLVGIVSPDDVTLTGTGTFNNASVGTGKAVTSSATLGGVNAGNYTLTQPTGLTGNITAPPQSPDQTFTRAARLTLKILRSVVLAACSSPDGYPLALTGVGTSSQAAVLSLNATYIFYTPATGNDNNDSFSYTVADGHGGSFTGTIHVTVVATTGGQAQQISASGGRVTVQFAGIPGYTYRVLRATDAAFTQDVTTLDTITAPANGLFSYTDLNPPNPTAYYRMQTP